MTYICPVCGYDELTQPPKNFSICDSCGTEFESDDFDRSYAELRHDWISRHMPWFSKSTLPPRNWSPYRQLVAANFGSDLVEHPRMKTDEDYRYAVDEAWSDVRVSRQLKILRESRAVPLTQRALADLADMKQSRISELEGMNYSAWSVSTLKRLARALGVRFAFSFAGWGELLSEVKNGLSREALSIEQAPAFASASLYEPVSATPAPVINKTITVIAGPGISTTHIARRQTERLHRESRNLGWQIKGQQAATGIQEESKQYQTANVLAGLSYPETLTR